MRLSVGIPIAKISWHVARRSVETLSPAISVRSTNDTLFSLAATLGGTSKE